MVSEQPNKYKIYELYINEMFFPKVSSSEGVDLFVSITPCAGLLKYYISDNFGKLFTKRSEINHDQKFSKLDASKEDLPDQLEIEHKLSKVTTGNDTYLHENDYNEFGIQGKRIKHVDKIVGKKIYIGIKALNWEAEHKDSNAQMSTRSGRGNGRRRSRNGKVANFAATQTQVWSKQEDDMAVFEIEANYIGSNEMDYFDEYQIANASTGIQISKVRRGDWVQFRWSPLMRQEREGHFVPVRFGVIYKLYLGYNDMTFDLFSSLCMLEESMYLTDREYNLNVDGPGEIEGPGGKRCLQPMRSRQGPEGLGDRPQRMISEFDYNTPDLKIMHSYGQPVLNLAADSGVLTNLTAVGVMAYIFR